MSTAVGVVIPAKNRWQDTLECIQSLWQSSTPLQIIVVDGGSSDETVEAAKYLRNVVYLRDENKTTFSAMVNFGVNHAFYNLRLDSVLILNNDTVVQADAIALMSDNIYNGVGVVTPRINYYGTSNVWSAGGADRLRLGLTWHENIRSDDPGLSGPRSWGTGCAMLISKRCWRDVRGFDEKMPWYDSDVDFCFRARNRGYVVQYVNDAVIEHKIGSSSSSLWQYKEKIKGRLALIAKHVVWYERPLAVAGFLAQSLARYVRQFFAIPV